jgi:6-phosphogluconate dehydrogenase (decarboxylating)
MNTKITQRLVHAGHRVVEYARSAESRQRVVQVGGDAAVPLHVMDKLRAPAKTPRHSSVRRPAHDRLRPD